MLSNMEQLTICNEDKFIQGLIRLEEIFDAPKNS